MDIETEKNRNTNMLKRKPTRIELKDLDEEFTNVVEQFKSNDNSNYRLGVTIAIATKD